MKRICLALPLLALIGGCAGTINRDNIYAGEWTGPYTDVTRPATGSVDWDILVDGTMSGTITRDSDGEVGTFTGTIDQSGQFTGSATFASGGNFDSVDGSITYSSSDTVGNFHYYFDGDWTTATFTLEPVVTP
ncbi:MAG: hypothetical protein JNK63_06610 [Chthonomonas sp.]|nr:hypothetical protein [Chthonomonas sp.]